MSTLIISDRIRPPEWSIMQWSSWTSSRPSVEGYDIVILDLYFGPPTSKGYYEMPVVDRHFYELGEEVVRSLQGGGVVIALLAPLTVTRRDLTTMSHHKQMVNLKKDPVNCYDGKYVEKFETSYDWLDQGFLEETRIDGMFAKQTEGITVVSPRNEMKTYAGFAGRYWVSIRGIHLYSSSKDEGRITYRVAQTGRWDCSLVQQHSATILAVGKHTRLPVAAAMRYMRFDGVLVLLPPFELRLAGQPGASEEVSRLCHVMESLAKGIKEDFAERGAADHEDWVFEHRAPRAREIVSEIDHLERTQTGLAQELECYDRMLGLLDGTGDPLVDSVATLFGKPGEGVRVERTVKGASIDLFVYDDKNRRLVMEVTGIKGALKKADPHWADFLEYLPEHHERNENGRTERMVLVANTQCKTKLHERNRSRDITSPVRQTVTDNHICLIRSCDLYRLWLSTLAGLSMQEVFDTLFDCDGVFESEP